jgi:hypothetical protein
MEAAMSARFQKKVRPSPRAEPLRVTHAHDLLGFPEFLPQTALLEKDR